MMVKRKAKLERLRGVLGLSAADMTYEEMARFIGVGSRQRVQQLVVDAVDRLPQLAERLGVTGRRHPGRRLGDGHPIEPTDMDTAEEKRVPDPTVRARHIALAKQLLDRHGGRYPSATEMLRGGQGALYQYMRKYPSDFERLIREPRISAGRLRRKRRRRRRF